MKKLIMFLILLSATAVYSSEYSDFAAKEYGERCNIINPHITVKKEHVEEYAQEIGQTFVPYIAYGYGDLKGKKYRKQRVSYLCLLDCKLKPMWSYIISR